MFRLTCLQKQFLLLVLSFRKIVSSSEIDMGKTGFKCVYIISNAMFNFDKTSSNVYTNLESDINIEQIDSKLKKSPRCLIRTSLQDEKLLSWLSSIERHLVLLENMSCSKIPASQYQTEMYCKENGEIWEKYRIREQVVFRLVLSREEKQNLASLSSDKLRRRSNLQGTEFKVTTLKTAYRIKDVEYGNKSESRISGLFGDFFLVLSSKLNFTFSLHKPADKKWGGRSKGRRLGWNGMVGDIAEGLVDFGIGPFTISAARSEAIRFSIGNIGYVKTFFLSTNVKKSFNFSLFLEPLAFYSWITIILVIILTALVLYFIIKLANDKHSKEFNLRKCFTFTISGISFVRRWTVTPVSIPGRIVFITVLLTGVLTQVCIILIDN